jgi:glycosyltransferase involved in cell wall biosynthesis
MGFRISIVTATLNRKEFIGRCIESIAAQPYPDKEHIIVDGGSTDGALEIIQEYAARYPHIKWRSGRDSGISDAFNKGLAMATGDAIGVLGDDDFCEPDIFAMVAEEFQRDPAIGIVSGNCAHLRNDNSVWMVQRAGFNGRRDLIECWKHWGKRTMIPAPSSFIRKRAIDVVGGFEESDRYAMDYHHWIKITEKFGVKTIDRTLANFRCDEGTVSYSLGRKQWEETLRISRRYWGSKLSRDYYRMLYSFLMDYRRPLLAEAWRKRKKELRRSLRRFAKGRLIAVRRVFGMEANR